MDINRKNAIAAGMFYITATLTSIIGLILYAPILDNPNFLSNGAEKSNQIILGALFEIVLVCAAICTAAILFPYLRKIDEKIALGYILFRFLEVVFIVVGILSILAFVSLCQGYIDSDMNSAALTMTGTMLIAMHDWSFIIGPNLMLGMNTFLYSYLFYRSNLIPSRLGQFGMVAAVLIMIAALLEMFGIIHQVSIIGALLALPIFLYEMILAGWLIFKGFNKEVIEY